MSSERFIRALWACEACQRLAEHNKLYRYTIYPFDYLFAKTVLWWYS